MFDPSLLEDETWANAQAFLNAARAAGKPLRITQGKRDPAYQDKLYAQGRTLPGPIVTYATSAHDPHVKGMAIDICVDGPVPYPANYDWEAVGRLGEAAGFFWGGRFRHHPDLLHFELPDWRTRTEA